MNKSEKIVKCVTLTPENLSYINSKVDLEEPSKKDFSKALNYTLDEGRALLKEFTRIKSNNEIINNAPKLNNN